MDRKIEYPGQILTDTELLGIQRNVMNALGYAMQAVLGANTLVDGLACAPTSPASMNVSVGAGAVYSLQNVDGTAYGSLGADTNDSIMKQGISSAATLLSCPAPTTPGQSVVYLVEAAFDEIDGSPQNLFYFNSANPSIGWSGPNNSGVAQNTVRKGACVLQAKSGVAANTGSQLAPAVDSGFTGLYTVTVGYGQTAISPGNIATVTGAPFIGEKLTAKISQATGDARYLTPASTTTAGIVALATTAMAEAGTNNTTAVTPAGLAAALTSSVPGAPAAATTSAAGIVALATTAMAQAGTDTAAAITSADLAAATLGSSVQSWQNVTSSRALSTTYYNMTGRPIALAVYQEGGSAVSLEVWVSGIQLSWSSVGTASGVSGFAIVPNGASYSVTATTSVTQWNELR